MILATTILLAQKLIEWPSGQSEIHPFLFMIIGGIVFFGSTALAALWWAARHGEFENFTEQSLEIFDKDEPVGVVTDHFPDKTKKKS